MYLAENTNWTVDLLFKLLGFSCFVYVELASALLVLPNPTKLNRMSAIQWSFPIWWVYSCTRSPNVSWTRYLISLWYPAAIRTCPQCMRRICRSKKMSNSVTRWLDYLFNIWPLTAVKISPQACYKYVEEGYKFCQNLTNPYISAKYF